MAPPGRLNRKWGWVGPCSDSRCVFSSGVFEQSKKLLSLILKKQNNRIFCLAEKKFVVQVLCEFVCASCEWPMIANVVVMET